jgi:hypothetical protein
MDVSDASFYIFNEKMEINGAHQKKIFKNEKDQNRQREKQRISEKGR